MGKENDSATESSPASLEAEMNIYQIRHTAQQYLTEGDIKPEKE